MEILRPSYYFDTDHYLIGPLSQNCETVFELVTHLDDFVHRQLKGKVLGKLEEGAWIEPDMVDIGEGSMVERGAIIRGPTIIGKNTLVRSGCYIRGNTIIGDNCKVGFGTEINRSILHDNTYALHKNIIFSSIIGSNVNFGGMATIANLRNDGAMVRIPIVIDGHNEFVNTNLQYFGAIVGDGCKISSFALMQPGTLLGPESCIFNYCAAKGVYPPQSKISD